MREVEPPSPVSAETREEASMHTVKLPPPPPAEPRVDLHERLVSARKAFYGGKGRQAQRLYREVLEHDSGNRDALLGLAAGAVRANRHGEAAGFYMQLLELDPRDSMALAGLASLNGNVDPMGQESRIKTMLQGEPDAPHLHFALGGLFAAQSRWGEAQQAFFRALSGDRSNADYAFNLAVSLDHLGQERAALPYYQRALSLARVRPGQFDRRKGEARLNELAAAFAVKDVGNSVE